VLDPLPKAKPFQMSIVKSCEVLKVLLVLGLDAGPAARSLVELGQKRLEVYEAGDTFLSYLVELP
jgi:hypothetical protein